MKTDNVTAGFIYDIEHVREGLILSTERVHNIIPTAGMNHILDATFHGGTQILTWYAGLFSGNYVPVLTDVAATFSTLATEFVGYSAANRITWVEGVPAAGAIDNSATPAEFTLTADSLIYGSFLISTSGKGVLSGTLVSAAKFAAAKDGKIGDIIRVKAGFTLVNA